MHGYYNVFAGKPNNHPQDLAWANAFVYGSITDPEAMPEAKMPPGIKFLRKNGIPARTKTEDSISGKTIKGDAPSAGKTDRSPASLNGDREGHPATPYNAGCESKQPEHSTA